MSAGLLASTVTPGRTAPVASFTTPAIALCARPARGRMREPTATSTSVRRTLRIPYPPDAHVVDDLTCSPILGVAEDITADRLTRAPFRARAAQRASSGAT